MRRGRSKTLAGGALAVALALSLTACGSGKHPYDATAENNGYYVKAGPLYYQLQVSRQLNQFGTEDSQYLTGLPYGTAAPTSNQLWYAVFLQALNKTQQPQPTANSFDIVDTQGNKYYPVPLKATANEYAWRPTRLPPLGTEPAPDTTAFFGPTQGAELLFKLNTSIYTNRPLTLQIHVPGSSQVSTISLDL
jgi:hypothetical protein